MTDQYRRFLKCRSGATAIEYALIAALLSIVIIGAVAILGQNVNGMFTFVSERVSAGLGG